MCVQPSILHTLPDLGSQPSAKDPGVDPGALRMAEPLDEKNLLSNGCVEQSRPLLGPHFMERDINLDCVRQHRCCGIKSS